MMLETVDNRGNTGLHMAVRDNCPAVVDHLLDRDLDTQNRAGQTALHIACSRGAESSVRSLLEHGARPDIADVYGDTPLHDAAVKNHQEIVKLLLDRPETVGAILDSQNSEGQTALQGACLKGAEDVVEILINAGANTAIEDNHGDTALYYAVKGKHVKVVELLLEDLISHSDNLSTQFRTGKTALHYACKFGLESIVMKLLEGGVKTDVVDDNGSIALYYAVKKNEATIAQVLLSESLTKQADILDLQSKQGHTVLHHACFNGMAAVVKTLLELGVNSDVEDEAGWTPLHWAVQGDQHQVVETLLKKGVDINMTNSQNQTALHLACKRGDRLIVKALLDHGAMTDLEQDNGDTALCITMDLLDNLDEDEEEEKDSHLQVVMLLIDNMTSVPSNLSKQYKNGKTAVHYACKYGLESMVEKLIERGATMDCVDNEGDTVLHEAARENPELVTLLLKVDKELVNKVNQNGRTALHIASFYGAVEVVVTLLAAGARADLVDVWGDSPLHDAAGRNHHQVVDIILSSQAICIDTVNRNGQTPLHIACLRGAVAVVQSLLQHGAGTDILDKRGHSPLGNALVKNHPEIVKIISRGKDCTSELTSNISAISNHREVVRFIIEEVDFEHWRHQGNILLKSAAERNDKDMSAILIEKGVQSEYIKDDFVETSDSEEDSDEDSDVNSDEDDAF